MTTYFPHYRMTVYAGRSVDLTEATILTPAAGAAHSDSFKVTTELGQSGWQPYLDSVSGRRGRLDPLTKRTDTGQLTVRILDRKAGALSDNLTRWMTAFLGNSVGVSRLIGLKVYLEENLGDGNGWAAFWTGRITALALHGALCYEVTIRDMAADMQVPVFVSAPSATVRQSTSYTVQTPSLLPVGLLRSYGIVPLTSAMSGTIQNRTVHAAGGVSYAVADLVFDANSLGRADNTVTEELQQARLQLPPAGSPVPPPTWGEGRLRVHITSSSAGSSGDFLERGMITSIAAGRNGLVRVDRIRITELFRASSTSADPPGYLAMPTTGVTVQAYVFLDGQLPVDSVAHRLLIDDVHPLRLWRDLLDGYYGYLWRTGEQIPSGAAVGDAKRRIPYSTAQFSTATATALINDATIPNGRFMISKKDRLDSWIEKNILQPYQLGFYLDGSGQVVPVDLRRPTSLPSLTITDADLAEQAVPEWAQDRGSAVTRVVANAYVDWPLGGLSARVDIRNWPRNQTAAGTAYPLLTGLFPTITDTIELLDIGNSDAGEQEVSIDAQGFRSIPQETLQGQQRTLQMRQTLIGLVQNLQQPYGSGAQIVALRCRRTSNTSTCQPGDLRLVNVSVLPDPATNLRGGTRLMRCVERSEEGLALLLRFLDLGVNVTASPPTVGTVSQSTADTRHSVQSTITLNASTLPAEIHYAVTTGGSTAPPGSSDPSWTFAELLTASRVLTRGGLPSASRVFLRGRTLPGNANSLQMPSSWVPATSPGYIDLASLAGPTGLAASVATQRVDLSWTAGSTDYLSEVRLAQPSTGTESVVATLPAGQTQVRLALLANSSYGASVQHTDGVGGYSTASSVTFSSTAGTAATCPDVVGIHVVRGKAS